MRTIRIASAQTPEFREDVEAALDFAITTAAQAEYEGASLLCFPEGYLQGYLTTEESARRVALNFSSPAFENILGRFPKTGPVIVMGVIEEDGGKLFNTAIVVNRGVMIGCYRKAHLFKGAHTFEAGCDNKVSLVGGESCFEPGVDSHVFEVAGLRFGINICYDTNFPEAARKVAALGASLIVCPANNMCRRKVAEDLKEMHNAVRGERCRETGLWLVSSDVTGERDGRIAWGPTAVLNPHGEVVAQLPLDRTGLLIFDMPC